MSPIHVVRRRPPVGTVYWYGDVSVGDWRNFYGVQAGLSITPLSPAGPPPYYQVDASLHGQTRAAIVTSPVRQAGQNTIQLATYPPISDGSSHENAGIQQTGPQARAAEGMDTYYGWSLYLPSANIGQYVNNDGSWNLFFEFLGYPEHFQQLGYCQTSGPTQAGCVSGQQIGMGIDTATPWSSSNPAFYLGFGVTSTGTYNGGSRDWTDTVPITHDVWTDFVLHMKWSSAAGGYTDGTVEMWKNGVLKFSQYNVRTTFQGQGDGTGTNAPLMNYHGSIGASVPGTIIHNLAAYRIGSTYASVNPAQGV